MVELRFLSIYPCYLYRGLYNFKLKINDIFKVIVLIYFNFNGFYSVFHVCSVEPCKLLLPKLASSGVSRCLSSTFVEYSSRYGISGYWWIRGCSSLASSLKIKTEQEYRDVQQSERCCLKQYWKLTYT